MRPISKIIVNGHTFFGHEIAADYEHDIQEGTVTLTLVDVESIQVFPREES